MMKFSLYARTGIQRSFKNGIVLLFVLGVLALMSVLAVTFVSVTRLERAISRNYVDHVRARLAAESGIEKTIAVLDDIIGTPDYNQLDWMRFGLDEDQAVTLFETEHPSFGIDLDGDQLLFSSHSGHHHPSSGLGFYLELLKLCLGGLQPLLHLLRPVQYVLKIAFCDHAISFTLTNVILFYARTNPANPFTWSNALSGSFMTRA